MRIKTKSHETFSLTENLKVTEDLNLSEDYKDEKEALYYYTDDSVAMVFP